MLDSPISVFPDFSCRGFVLFFRDRFCSWCFRLLSPSLSNIGITAIVCNTFSYSVRYIAIRHTPSLTERSPPSPDAPIPCRRSIPDARAIAILTRNPPFPLARAQPPRTNTNTLPPVARNLVTVVLAVCAAVANPPVYSVVCPFVQFCIEPSVSKSRVPANSYPEGLAPRIPYEDNVLRWHLSTTFPQCRTGCYSDPIRARAAVWGWLIGRSIVWKALYLFRIHREID